ncbi:MAG: ABC transporter permease [Chloroflexota bacterium]
MAVQQEGAEFVAVGRLARAPLATRLWKGVIGFLVKKPLGAAGAIIILVMISLALSAPIITEDPMAWNLSENYQGSSTKHLLGTNDVGQDIWAQVVHGARISLYVGILAVAFGSGTGGAFGLISAFYGGKVDIIIQRIMDAFMSIPTLILALAIMAALGGSVNNVVLAVGIVQIPRANRIVRSQAMSVKQSEFVMAARSIGANDVRIMIYHMFPQCIAPWLIIASAGLGTAIIAEASLSFLGMGVPPMTPTWGGMLSQRGREYFALAPQMAIWPGVAISLAVYGFNLFGDAIRDVMDPRLRGT